MKSQLTPVEKRFVTVMYEHARIADIALALGRSESLVRKTLRQKRLLAGPAVKEAWARWQAGRKLDFAALRLWEKLGTRAVGTVWTETEKLMLAEHVGTRSIESLARALKRSQEGIRRQIRLQGLVHHAYGHSLRGLASALNIDRRLVTNWCDEELVRWYWDGSRKMIHREDAEELVDCFYLKNWHEAGIPKHPGAMRRRAGYDKPLVDGQ